MPAILEPDKSHSCVAARPALNIGVICDFLEEKWPSMDLVAEMVLRHLASNHADEIAAVQLRPAMLRPFGRIPILGRQRLAHNTDRLLNRFVVYPHWLRRQAQGLDLFHLMDHSYAQLLYELPPERTVVTCHDLDTFRCLLAPDREPRSLAFRKMTQRILNGLLRAAHVICVSRATQTALLKCGWFPPERISVIHYGVHPSFSAEPDPGIDAELERSLENVSGAPLLLHVGSGIPRKRIDILLRVYAGIRKEFPRARLIRVGGILNQPQARLADELGVSDGISVFPHLSRERLAACYRKATLLLQTSEAEGFGLPVIEAMACGCPVLASDIPALREAGGSAAQFCGVGDIAGWTDAAVAMLRENADARRLRRNAAIVHSSGFSWRETVAQTVEVYRRVLQLANASHPVPEPRGNGSTHGSN